MHTPPTLSLKQLDPLIPMYLDVAAVHGIKVCFHIEPYKGRTAHNTATNMQLVIDKYG
jgi:glycoprotein endo-alpha-1,2-mannosidase